MSALPQFTHNNLQREEATSLAVPGTSHHTSARTRLWVDAAIVTSWVLPVSLLTFLRTFNDVNINKKAVAASSLSVALVSATLSIFACSQGLLLGGILRFFAPASSQELAIPRRSVSDDRTLYVASCRVGDLTLRLGLPIFAALQIGGFPVAVFLLLLLQVPTKSMRRFETLSKLEDLPAALRWLSLALLLLLADAYLLCGKSLSSVVTAAFALLLAATNFTPPYLSSSDSSSTGSVPPPSTKSTSAVPTSPFDDVSPAIDIKVIAEQGLSEGGKQHAVLSMVTGLLLSIISFGVHTLSDWEISGLAWALLGSLGCVFATVNHYCSARMLRDSEHSEVLIAALAIVATNPRPPVAWLRKLMDMSLAALPYLAGITKFGSAHTHGPQHGAHSHTHKTQLKKNVEPSKVTKYLIKTTSGFPLVQGILVEKNSRRIFYFMFLNLFFMFVQSTYGVLTGSLGLISDSIHMFFDCVALLMGLFAAVMSKWPPSARFPYGYGKIDTLAGFANGVFLMLISVEIIYEAAERLVEGAEIARTIELLIVSSIGLLVNLIGLLAFDGHHHHGHSHGGHSHDHGHAHIDTHGHAHDHNHFSHPHNHAHSASILNTPFMTPGSSPAKAAKVSHSHHAHGHSHAHGSENMEGIYLHIMADALGSVAVVISTVLVRYTNWSGWDPVASVIIAVAIFASAIPLVKSTAKSLLLSLDSETEYDVRDALGGITNLNGVIGCTVPKFWIDEYAEGGAKEHNELHEHNHGDHSHDHDHAHDHGHQHDHSYANDHTHSHGHQKRESRSSNLSIDTGQGPAMLGVIHIIASKTSDLEDVRSRVSVYLKGKNMNIIIQVEREGEGKCWCGGGMKTA